MLERRAGARRVLIGFTASRAREFDRFAKRRSDRLLITDWLALHLDVRDHVFETDLTGRVKNVHNIEATLGITTFF